MGYLFYDQNKKLISQQGNTGTGNNGNDLQRRIDMFDGREAKSSFWKIMWKN